MSKSGGIPPACARAAGKGVDASDVQRRGHVEVCPAPLLHQRHGLQVRLSTRQIHDPGDHP